MHDVAAIILAAGKGSRMKSDLPKVMHKIGNMPMIRHILRTLEGAGAGRIVTVIAPGMDDVAKTVSPHATAVQERQLGSGDAAKAALPALSGFSGYIVIAIGDAPLITADTFGRLVAAARVTGLSVLGMRPENPTGYGRLVLDDDAFVAKIVEERDADARTKAIDLCNAGNFCVSSEHLPALLAALKPENDQKEFYLTDIVALAAASGVKCAYVEASADEVQGVNSRAQLAQAELTFQNGARVAAMAQGATLVDPSTVYFSADTVIGRDTVIEPNVFFGPGVTLGAQVIIHAFSHLEGVAVDDGAHIGPFARVRPKSRIGKNVTVGNFVEVNRATMRDGSKSKHVSYLGDADIGEKTNIGAGTVIANYDGFDKNDTVIGKGAFTGSNSTIVAPVKIGDGAFVAAGSTITTDVPADALSIARAGCTVKEGWAAQYRETKRKTKG